MFAISTKSEYNHHAKKKWVDLSGQELKAVQDGFILSQLHGVSGKKILEIGGGQSRVIPHLVENNECWNADPLQGAGNGPTEIDGLSESKLVSCYLGDFDPVLPDSYFDILFSISTIEHVPGKNLEAFMDDCIRIMKPGALSVHAIDLYVPDHDDPATEFHENQRRRINRYRELVEDRLSVVDWAEAPVINGRVFASAKYAANSNNTLFRWSRNNPKLKDVRETSQSVSLKWAFRKK